jgi:hypothetical protein
MKDIKDIKYGLVALDPLEEGDSKTVLHFVGYWSKPEQFDADALKTELMTNEQFGLTEIAHRLEILPAPDYIVEEYVKEVLAQMEDNERNHNELNQNL